MTEYHLKPSHDIIYETRAVRKVSNSMVVTLPTAVLKKLNLHEGDEVAYEERQINGETVIEVKKKPTQQLDLDSDFLQSVQETFEEYKTTLKELSES